MTGERQVEDRHGVAPPGLRILEFLGGEPLFVPESACRGCLMNELEGSLPDLLDPVYDDGAITVRQDAEWAVPGFMVVAVRPHVGGLDEMELPLAERVVRVTRAVRAVMREQLGLAAVQMYQEDKVARPHFHLWMLPLWPETMAKHAINPRIYESNIVQYLELFPLAENEAAVRSCAETIRAHLPDNSSLFGRAAR